MSLLSPWRSVRPWGKSRSVALRVWCLALGIVFALADVALCQSREVTPWSAAEFPEIRRLFVPADDPGAWPEGNWEPRPISQFLKELQGARVASRRRSGPPFVEAIYEATLLGDSLRDGRLRWKLAQRDLPASFVDLAPLELPLDNLAWDRSGKTADSRGNPVVFWGRTTDGRLGFCTTPGEYRLAGSWGLDGRRLGGSLEFQFKLPPATVSTIHLRLPVGMTLSSSGGTVTGPRATEDAGWSVWQVALGQSHECRLRITRAAASQSTAGVVVSRPDLRFNVRPESTRFRALFDVASWEATTDQVSFEIPTEAELSAVTYGDSDVVWRREGESREKLVLLLPTPARGSLRRIELQGILPPTEEPGWRMPLFRAIGALEMEGHIAVRLAPSFRAAALRFTGLRQFVYETSQDDEVFEFRRLRSDATLEFVPASRPVRLACRSVGWLNLGDENQFQGDLEWSATEGRTWSATCTLSDDWEVIDARIPATDRSERLADWSVESQSDGRQRLLLHLSDALEPEHPLRVRVVARSRSGTVPRRVALPILAAETDLTLDNVQLVTSDRGTTLDPDAASQFDRLVPSELPLEIRDIDFVKTASQRSAREFFGLQSRSTHSHGVVEADAAQVGAGGGTLVDADPAPVVANSAAKPHFPSPVVARSIQAVVDVCGEESGFDSYRLEIEILGGTEQSELRWKFPSASEPPAVMIDGQPAIPVGPISDYRHGVLLTRKGISREATGRRRVVLQYRVAAQMRWGPSRRQLVFPELDVPVLEAQFELRLPRSIRLAYSPKGIVPQNAADQPRWIPPLSGPLGRPEGEELFNPLIPADWKRLFVGSTGEEERPLPYERWLGGSLELPTEVELVVWNRTEAASLNWWSFLATLWLGLVLRIRWRDRPLRIVAAALALGLVGAVLLPETFAEIQGSGFAGLIGSQLLPTAWIWSKRSSPRGMVPGGMVPPTGGTRVGAPLRAIGLLLLAGWSLFAPRGLLGQAPVSSPGSVSRGQREYLGDVLIPVSSDGDATPWPDVVYVSRELRQRLAEITRQTELPGVLLRDVACDMGTDGQGRSVVEAHLTFCLPRSIAIRIPLPFAGVTLADERACQIAGVDQELLPAPEGIGYVLDWRPPSTLAWVDQGDRPAPPDLPCDEESGGCVLSVAMRLFPAADEEDLDGVRRIQIPFAARAMLPGVDDDTRPGWSFVEAVGVLTSIQGSHAERIAVAARLVAWRDEPKSPSRRVDPLRIEAWTLVEFDGSLALLRCGARYVPGNRPVDWLLWNIPPGMAVRQVTTPGLGGYAVTDNSHGERQLEIDFLEPRKEPFEVIVDLVLPVTNTLFELKFPDPAATPPGGTTALELRQYRAAVRYPLDRRIQISSPAVDQPLRALNLSDLEREGRFTDVTLNAAYELDRPLSLLLLIEPADMKLAGSVEQRGTLRPGQLEWKFVADGVRSTQSVFQYELQVDPRLEIRRVAVFERDERPARWSREGDRVTLFLAARAGNTQRIELTGVLPLDAHGEVAPPRVSLNRLTPLNERRLLLAPSGVDTRLIVDGAPGSGSDASGVLLDAPAALDAPWPRIRVIPATSPVPADTETPEPSTESETAEPEEITTQVMELELAEINLSRSPAGGSRGRLRLWIPAGEETEFSLVVPHEVSLDTVIWKDQVLPLLVGDSGDLKVRLPDRDRGSLLEADWKLSADAPSRIPSPWGENFNRPVWPRDARVARMLFTFSYSTEALLAVRAPFRRVTPLNAAEMRRDADVIARLEDSTPAPPGVSAASEILVGSQRATTELSRTGLLAGAAWLDWPRAKPLAAGLLLLILSILLWWSSGLVYWLQARSGICTLMISLVWWIFLTPGGLGCLIAIISLPFAVRDLFREQRVIS